LPTGPTRDTHAARVEVVKWPAAVRACLCGSTTSTQKYSYLRDKAVQVGCRINNRAVEDRLFIRQPDKYPVLKLISVLRWYLSC